jgi:hypothetical protein
MAAGGTTVMPDRCLIARHIAASLFCAVLHAYASQLQAGTSSTLCYGTANGYAAEIDYVTYVSHYNSAAHGFATFQGFVIRAPSGDHGLLFADLVRCVPEMGFARIFSDVVGSNITASVASQSGYASLTNPAFSQWASNFLFVAYAPNALITSY